MTHIYQIIIAALLLVSSFAYSEEDREKSPDFGVWVTFDVRGDRFKAVVNQNEAIDYVFKFVAGQASQKIPFGKVYEGGLFNQPWAWHFDPNTVSFKDAPQTGCLSVSRSIETDKPYCSEHARIVRAQDCRTGKCVPLRGLYAGRSPAF